MCAICVRVDEIVDMMTVELAHHLRRGWPVNVGLSTYQLFPHEHHHALPLCYPHVFITSLSKWGEHKNNTHITCFKGRSSTLQKTCQFSRLQRKK